MEQDFGFGLGLALCFFFCGRLWGSDSFVAQIEKALHVRLLPKKPGPKPREQRTPYPGLRIRCIE